MTAPPPSLDGFTFLRPLGSGGFSDVFLYRQHLPDRAVAVKVLHAATGSTPAQTFAAEANLMARLSAHPAIVTIHQAAVARDGRPYLIMEFCPPPNLQERSDRSPLPVAEALDVMIRIAGAVETAHRAGIIHRDIKPANILANAYGRPCLTDFGISASRGAPADQASGLSVLWAAPEVVDGSSDGDELADIYALAATTYCLLAGHSPFVMPGAGNRTADIIARIASGRATPLQRQDVPIGLRRAIAQGLEHEPQQRPRSAADFARQLQTVQSQLRLPVTPLEVLGEANLPASDAAELDATVLRTRPKAAAPTWPAPPVRQPAAPTKSGVGAGIIAAAILTFIGLAGLVIFGVYTVASLRLDQGDEAAGAATPTPTPTWDPAAAGFRDCGGGVYGNEVTSCPFAANVAKASNATGGAQVLPEVYSPVTGTAYRMTCDTASGWVVCRGGDNAEVAFRAESP